MRSPALRALSLSMRSGRRFRGGLLLLALCGFLCVACPPRPPVERPRPAAFDPLTARRHITLRLAELERSPEGATLERAALRRDLGWLLWAHLGDPQAARAEWKQALAMVEAGKGEARIAAPWLRAGLASTSDVELSMKVAAEQWIEVLVDVGRAAQPGTRRLPPPEGIAPDTLTRLAMSQITDAASHMDNADAKALLERLSRASLAPLLRSSLAQLHMNMARRLGDVEGVRRHQGLAGCPAAYVVSPRHGRYPRLDLHRTFPPEREARLAGTRHLTAFCRITLRSPDGQGGVRYAEAMVRSARGGPAVVKLAYPEPVMVWLGDVLVHDRDPEERPRPLLRHLAVTLQPGENRLRLKLPVSATPRPLYLLVVEDAPSVASHEKVAPKEGATSVTGQRAGANAGAGAEPKAKAGAASRPQHASFANDGASPLAIALRQTYRPLAHVLSVSESLNMGLPDAGREAAERLAHKAPRFSLGLLTAARLEELDPLQPAAFGRERARPLLSKALQIQPSAARARVRLASLLRQQERSREALTLLAAAPKGSLDAQRLLAYARIELYLDLGWRSLAAREAQALAHAHPDWLAAWRLHHRLSRMEHAAPLVREAAERLRALDATSLALAELLATEGKLPEALAELDRVAKIAGGQGGEDRSRWLRQAGENERTRRRLVARLAAAAWEPERRLALADLLVALGRREEATRLLSEGLAMHPEHLDFRRALAALGEPHPMETFRTDGLQAIADYRQAGWSPGTRAVHVLDRAVIRVLPSGGRLVLTHQIAQLRTKEDVHGYGEVRLPGGAEVLTLRTVKADGTTREPEDIQGKQTVSLPDLDVGDFIEAEYVSASPAEPWWEPGGFFEGRFFFQSVAAHYFRSELLVVTAPGHQLTLSSSAGAPSPVESTEGELRVLRFTAQRVERLEPEPLSTHLGGILPSVQIGSRVRWPDFLTQRREIVWGLAAETHHVRAIAREVCQGTPNERARRAFSWVQANVEERGGLGVSAAATAAGRSGSRFNLLVALFGACGLKDVQTHLVWARHLEHPVGALPPVHSFSQTVLGVTLSGEGHVFLLPQLQEVPFGYLPPTLQGALAVTVERPGDPPRRLPEAPEAEAHNTRLRVVLAKDGSAVVSGEDHLSGIVAMQLRSAIRSVPERRLRQALEQSFFARHFAGATLTMLVFEHATDTGRPLVLRYRLAVPALARAADGRLVLESPLFPAQLGRQFAALPTRRLPLQLGPLGPRRVTVDIEVPRGYALFDQPVPVTLQGLKGPVTVTAQSTQAPVRVDTSYGQLQLTLTRTKTGARLERTLRVPYRVVPPAIYAELTAAIAALDRLETPTLVFQR